MTLADLEQQGLYGGYSDEEDFVFKKTYGDEENLNQNYGKR